MASLDKAQWDNVAAKMKSYETLYAKNLTTNCYAIRNAFNSMTDDTKQAIADSFDSVLDLALQDELMDIKKKCGIGTYGGFLGNKSAIAALKEAGIAVTAVDENGNIVDNPEATHRDWVVSRIDENGKVIQDENGKLAQFKWRDFNSDSAIQTAEAYVNDLLKTAGYDCVSHLDYTDEELLALRNLKGTASDVDARSSVASHTYNGNSNSSNGESATTGEINGLSGLTEGAGGNESGTSSGKTGVTREIFNEKVKQYMAQKDCSKTKAEKELLEIYEIME